MFSAAAVRVGCADGVHANAASCYFACGTTGDGSTARDAARITDEARSTTG